MRWFILALALLCAAPPASTRQIATDLSSHEIAITAGFDGAELLLFGHEARAEDIIVIVRGPDAPVSVRKKEQVAGIWVNRTSVDFDAAPGFYFVAVTPGLEADGRLETILAGTGLGAHYLGMTGAGDSQVVEEFRQALVELKAREQLYSTTPGTVKIRPDGLFRVNVPFPAATPVGTYSVTVYQVVDGWPVAGATTPLQVKKAGFGAFVYELAHDQPFLYGVIAIIVALVAGWFGGWAFRRR